MLKERRREHLVWSMPSFIPRHYFVHVHGSYDRLLFKHWVTASFCSSFLPFLLCLPSPAINPIRWSGENLALRIGRSGVSSHCVICASHYSISTALRRIDSFNKKLKTKRRKRENLDTHAAAHKVFIGFYTPSSTMT